MASIINPSRLTLPRRVALGLQLSLPLCRSLSLSLLPPWSANTVFRIIYHLTFLLLPFSGDGGGDGGGGGQWITLTHSRTLP